MNLADLPHAKSIESIIVMPDEVLAISVPVGTTPEQLWELHNNMKDIFPNTKFFIVPETVKFFKLSQIEAEKLAEPPAPNIPLDEMQAQVWNGDEAEQRG